MGWKSWGTEDLPPGDYSADELFTLGRITRWLAVEVKGNEQLIARAFLKDFQSGRFDGPQRIDRDLSEESDHFIIVPNEEVSDGIDLRWRRRWTDYLGRERWSLLDSQSPQAIFADSNPVEYSEPGAGGDGFWLCKAAINRWCEWHNLPRLSSWPLLESEPQAWAAKDEVLGALRTIGTSKRWKIPELHDEVARLLGKRLSSRSLNEAKNAAASKGLIRLYARGNPGKAERPTSG
jgi:hypothetical protein